MSLESFGIFWFSLMWTNLLSISCGVSELALRLLKPVPASTYDLNLNLDSLEAVINFPDESLL